MCGGGAFEKLCGNLVCFLGFVSFAELVGRYRVYSCVMPIIIVNVKRLAIILFSYVYKH